MTTGTDHSSTAGYRGRWRRIVSGEGSGLVRLALSAASVPYGIGVSLRSWAFRVGLKRVHHLGRPVVSVGNLTVGGTGKTPLVEALARRLGGRRVVILMRGYAAGPEGSDEVALLGENLPEVRVCPGADRVRQGRIALEEGEVDVFLLDDGFQHRRLHRDLDVVAVDALCPFGYGRLLPRGMLREPVGALRRADLVAVTRVNQVSRDEVGEIRRRIEGIVPGLEIVEFRVTSTLVRPDGEEEDAASRPLEGKEIVPFCGIGNPESFARTLREMGSEAEPLCFPDHHAYTRGDVSLLEAGADAKGAVALLTTQKDAPKVRRHGPSRPVWVVRVRAEPGTGVEMLDRRLSQIGKTEMFT